MLEIAFALITMAAEGQTSGALLEAQCIPDALVAQVKGRQPLEIEGPTAACKARYGWTAQETDAALAVANATGTVIGDAHRLQTMGVDLDLIEQIRKQVSPADAAALGTYDDRKDAEHLAAENNARGRIANLVVPRVKEDVQIPLQMAVADQIISHNTVQAFLALRAQRR